MIALRRIDGLQAILDAHALWIKTKGSAGKQAQLGGADLTEEDIRGRTLSKANLTGAKLDYAVFDEATILAGADLTDATIRGRRLHRMDFRNSYCYRTDFSGSDLRWIRFENATIDGADLRHATVSPADFRHTDITRMEEHKLPEALHAEWKRQRNEKPVDRSHVTRLAERKVALDAPAVLSFAERIPRQKAANNVVSLGLKRDRKKEIRPGNNVSVLPRKGR